MCCAGRRRPRGPDRAYAFSSPGLPPWPRMKLIAISSPKAPRRASWIARRIASLRWERLSVARDYKNRFVVVRFHASSPILPVYCPAESSLVDECAIVLNTTRLRFNLSGWGGDREQSLSSRLALTLVRIDEFASHLPPQAISDCATPRYLHHSV